MLTTLVVLLLIDSSSGSASYDTGRGQQQGDRVAQHIGSLSIPVHIICFGFDHIRTLKGDNCWDGATPNGANFRILRSMALTESGTARRP